MLAQRKKKKVKKSHKHKKSRNDDDDSIREAASKEAQEFKEAVEKKEKDKVENEKENVK